jgi:hypothetical protein
MPVCSGVKHSASLISRGSWQYRIFVGLFPTSLQIIYSLGYDLGNNYNGLDP